MSASPRGADRRARPATSSIPRTAPPPGRAGRSSWPAERDGLEFALRFGSPETGWRWCLGSVGVDHELGVRIGDLPGDHGAARRRGALPARLRGRRHRHGHHRHRRALRARQPARWRGCWAASRGELAGVAVQRRHPPRPPRERPPPGDARARRRRAAHVQRREALPARRRQRRRGSRSTSSVVRNADGGPQYFLSQMADIGERRAAEQALAQSEERFRSLVGGVARRRLRRSARTAAWPTRTSVCARSSTCPARSSTAHRGWSASPPRTATASSAEFRQARAPWAYAPRSTCAWWPASTAGRASTGPGLKGPGEPTRPRRHHRGRHRRGHGADGAGRARGRVPHARRALDRLPLAPHRGRHVPLRVAGLAGDARLGTPTAMIGRTPRQLGMDHPDDMEIIERNWVGALREERRAPPPTAPGAATARSCGWRRPSAPCAPRRREALEMVCVSARHLRAQERRARARSPRAARRAHRAAEPHAVPRPPRPGAAPLAPARARRVAVALPRPRPLQGRQRLARATRPATALLVDVAMRLSSRPAPRRHARALRRRRADAAVRGHRRRRGRRGRSPSACWTPSPSRFVVQDGEAFLHRPASASPSRATASRSRGPHPRRRRRDVPRQGPRPGESSSSTRRCARTCTTAWRWRPRCAAASSATSCACTASRSISLGRCAHRGLRGARALGASRARPRAAGSFIPLAEETGLIVPIGAWVAARGVRHAAAGSSTRPACRPCRSSVNVSRAPAPAAGLRRPGAGRPRRQRARARLVGGRDHRSAIMETGRGDPARAEGRSACALAMDDFGTGYSSLAHLRRFRSTSSRSTARSSPGWATGTARRSPARSSRSRHALGLRTVAEGIEDDEQRRAVLALGCDVGQGFLFARPMPADDLPRSARRVELAPATRRRRLVGSIRGMPDVVMPRLSDSMEEGTILKWLKAEGDEVARGDELVEIETDKATMTYEADTAPARCRSSPNEGDIRCRSARSSRASARGGGRGRRRRARRPAPAGGGVGQRRAEQRRHRRPRRPPQPSRRPRRARRRPRPRRPRRRQRRRAPERRRSRGGSRASRASTSAPCRAPGPGGRIVKADVEAAASGTAPAPARAGACPAPQALPPGARRAEPQAGRPRQPHIRRRPPASAETSTARATSASRSSRAPSR